VGETVDVVVVGSGNAGMSAALAARDAGARVLVVEKAPRSWAGGNTYFTAGAFRTTYASLDDLRTLVEIDDREAASIDLPPYGPADLAEDVERVTHGRADPELARILADESADAAAWLAAHGVRWRLLYERQSFRVDGRVRFWGNLVIGSEDGGRGLVEAELAAAERSGIELRFDTPVVDLYARDGRIAGVVCGSRGAREVIEAGAVVIAAGGYEADARRRAENLGPAWKHARVRGTPHNTGEVLYRALDAGAAPAGDWEGCHAIAWDAAAPKHGDRLLTNRFSRQAYPFGLVVNADGHRFVDEGADFRNYTYAKYGVEILRQRNGIAYQLFDQQTLPYVSRVDYDTAGDSRIEADSVAELEQRIGLPAGSLIATIDDYNAGVQAGRFDPTIKDGKGTDGVEPPKSNWALPFTHPPFVAFAVTCGITFTFGGVRIDGDGRVLDASGTPLPGLHAAGELVGGLFYHNYPGGSGLAAGTVFGRRAGQAAAAFAIQSTAPLAAVPAERSGDPVG
jgi:tricarballylate dehydrogenase